jgi:hypothetical protein
MPGVADVKVQSAVWNIELGRGRLAILWVATALAAVTLALLYTALEFRGLEKRESLDMAQLARNISRGQGFTTYVLRPLSLRQLKDHAPDHQPRVMQHPDLYHPPLYPLALAGIFRCLPAGVFTMPESQVTMTAMLPAERWVIVPFGQLCLLLSLLVVYFWARQLFDARVAVTAGLLLLFSDTLWSYAISGLPMTFLLLLWLLTLYCLFVADRCFQPVTEGARPRPRLGYGLVLVSAVLLGLCFLTRYRMAFLLVPLVIYVARIVPAGRRWWWAGLYAVVFAVVIAPWLVRNYALCGNVLGIAGHELAGDELLQRNYQATLTSTFSFGTIFRNLINNGRAHLVGTVRLTSSDFLIFFFGVGLLYGFRRPDAVRLRGVTLGAYAAALIGMSVIAMPGERVNPNVNGNQLLLLLLPLVAVFGTAFFYLLCDRIAFNSRLTRAAAVAGFVLLNVTPLITTLLPPARGAYPYPPYFAPGASLLTRWFGPDEIGVSDLPWATAWSADRRTLWLPATVAELVEINDYVLPPDKHVSFCLITPYMLDRRFLSDLVKGEYKDWSAIPRGQFPPNFPLKASSLYPPMHQQGSDQLLFADRPRWNQPGAAPIPPPPKPSETNTPPARPAR